MDVAEELEDLRRLQRITKISCWIFLATTVVIVILNLVVVQQHITVKLLLPPALMFGLACIQGMLFVHYGKKRQELQQAETLRKN